MLEAIHCERLCSLTFDQSARDYDARDANLIENVLGKPYSVLACQDDIDLGLLIGDNTKELPAATHSLAQNA